MAIVVICKACQTRFGVKDELAGRKIRCVKCAAVIEVSAQGSQVAAPKPPTSKPATSTSAGSAAPMAVVHKGDAAGTVAPQQTASASPAPVVRKARIVGREGDSSASVPVAAQVPMTAPQAATSNSSVVRAARVAQPAVAGAARVVDGPRDVIEDNIRHTAATLSAPPENYETLRKKVFASFTAERIEPVPVKWSYRIGIVLVSLVMLVLVATYVALIGMIGWGVWAHATNNTTWLSAASGVGTGRNAGRAMAFAFMAYMAPIIIGIMMIVFMFKPLFAKAASDSGRRSLKREDEPLLFDFIDRICSAVGAARPSRIDVDGNVNASASFGRGLLSFFSNDLVLTIGMPLAAGLTMRQFAGVMAHEFGHFAQGVGMRLTYLIRSISYWFTRVVYERDEWDEKLEHWSHEIDIRIGWMLYIARFAVWLTRKILWLLMMLGNLVGGFLLREMEFDADRYEARLAGSHIFPTTARQLAVLNVAHGGAMSDLSDFYNEGRLGDNLPKLILLNVDQLPKKVHTAIDEMQRDSTTGLFDTHPADNERTASAALENTDGIFRLRLPAAHLFRRFDWLSRAVTWDYYKEVFDEKLKKSDIHPVDELVERQKKQISAWKAYRRFFQGQISWYRALASPKRARKPAANLNTTATVMKNSRDVMLRELVRYQQAWKEYDEADTQQIEIGMAETLLKAGVRIRKADFSIPLTSTGDVKRAREMADMKVGDLEPKLHPFEQAATDRLYAGLQLLRTSHFAPALASASGTLEELDQLLELFDHTNERIGQLLAIRDSQIGLGRLMALFSDNRESKPLFNTMQEQMAGLNDLLVDLRQSFESTLYPFDHAKQDLTLADYLLETPPDKENPVEIYEAADSIGNALTPLLGRVIGRLCELAEAVETQLGLPPLHDPPEEEDDDDDDDE